MAPGHLSALNIPLNFGKLIVPFKYLISYYNCTLLVSFSNIKLVIYSISQDIWDVLFDFNISHATYLFNHRLQTNFKWQRTQLYLAFSGGFKVIHIAFSYTATWILPTRHPVSKLITTSCILFILNSPLEHIFRIIFMIKSLKCQVSLKIYFSIS